MHSKQHINQKDSVHDKQFMQCYGTSNFFEAFYGSTWKIYKNQD